MFGFAQGSRIIFLGLVFYIAVGIVVAHPELEKQNIFTCIWILFMAAFGIGGSLSNIPSITKAKDSAKTIFEVIDEKSVLDVRKSHVKQTTTIKQCAIEFKNVYFKYPSRDHIVLNNFNMRIPANAKVALVGHSGCGKSTVTNLMLRFYDIMSGSVTIDGIDIQNYNVK